MPGGFELPITTHQRAIILAAACAEANATTPTAVAKAAAQIWPDDVKPTAAAGKTLIASAEHFGVTIGD